jgi:RimJ/RimL family protein N-acetyltransferase
MELIPIKEKLEENSEFTANPVCQETIYMTIEFYKRVGFTPPWICYYATENGDIVGSAGIKGKPINGKIEIAYGTIEKQRNKGIGEAICKQLVNLSLEADPSVIITARTLPEKNFSTRIPEKNNFDCAGVIDDPEDGKVWEWVYKPK